MQLDKLYWKWFIESKGSNPATPTFSSLYSSIFLYVCFMCQLDRFIVVQDQCINNVIQELNNNRKRTQIFEQGRSISFKY